MNKLLSTAALALLFALPAAAQQSNINLSHNPQKDTEGLIPFSANLNSPDVHDDHTVTFRLRAPKAESVALSGAMTTVMGVQGRIPFTKGEDGIWTLTIGPLPVDMYQYNLVVDGVSMADPNNTYASFTAMPPYSELIIHGSEPMWYDAKEGVAHGKVSREFYYSPVTKGMRDIYVYTPPQYNPKKKYPVLYLMGGSGELPNNWMYDGRVNFIMDNLIAEGKAEPMIIAIVNNQVVHRNHPQHADLTFDIMEREYREAIIPFIDSHYKTIANPHGRAISGLSMGGRHTMFVGLNSLDLFANFGVLSAGDNKPEETSLATFLNDPKANDKVDYLFVGQGGAEEKGAFNVRVKGFRDALDKHGIEYEYYCTGIAGHDWSTWRHLLYERFLPNLWKK
ncbi:MAG: hypothetical protein MJY88_05070 [Bacteroidales bacterium]|nr:hypothetical protein [Bacteroidales bacterium]